MKVRLACLHEIYNLLAGHNVQHGFVVAAGEVLSLHLLRETLELAHDGTSSSGGKHLLANTTGVGAPVDVHQLANLAVVSIDVSEVNDDVTGLGLGRELLDGSQKLGPDTSLEGGSSLTRLDVGVVSGHVLLGEGEDVLLIGHNRVGGGADLEEGKVNLVGLDALEDSHRLITNSNSGL